MIALDPGRWSVEDAAARYQAAQPFPHVVLDDFVPHETLTELRAAFDEEDADRLQDEIFDVTASPSPPTSAALSAFHARLGGRHVLDAIGAITGARLASVETRAYVYAAGQYLLPHADRDDGGKRVVAYAYYVDALEDEAGHALAGGELDLYETETQGGEIVTARVRTTIVPRANRCVVFQVSPTSLHRVREIRAGVRLSLAGWFHR